jgi:hypothetical protein
MINDFGAIVGEPPQQLFRTTRRYRLRWKHADRPVGRPQFLRVLTLTHTQADGTRL